MRVPAISPTSRKQSLVLEVEKSQAKPSDIITIFSKHLIKMQSSSA